MGRSLVPTLAAMVLSAGIAHAASVDSTAPPPPTECADLNWGDYPYYPAGSDLVFPRDEGQHKPYRDYQMEWWYANFHLTDTEDPGREYGGFVAFFKLPRMRLLGISDLDQQIMYTDVQFPPFSRIDGRQLNLQYCHAARDSGSQTPTEPAASDSDLPRRADRNRLRSQRIEAACDRWYTKSSGRDPWPFEYHLDVQGGGDDPILLDLDLAAVKAPMIVGGTGLIPIGDRSSYYYSQTRLAVSGTIHLPGREADVTGYAWIDRQWGDFLPQPDGVRWEWFSIQLDDGREILVADLWLGGVFQGSFSGGLHLYHDDCSLEILDDYTITPLGTWTDPISGRTFSSGWTIQEPSEGIQLTVIPDFNEQVVYLTPGLVIRPPAFWEGSCSVAGTIGGQPVSGKAGVELTYSTPSD